MKEISAVMPDALMFGTHLPSTRACRPVRDEDVVAVVETLGQHLARKALRDNAVEFYRPDEARNA